MSRRLTVDQAGRLCIGWILVAAMGCAGSTETAESRADIAEPAPIALERVDELPKLIRLPQPVYPEVPRARGTGGVVGLDVLIGADGRVMETRIVHPVDAALDSAAVAAFQHADFRPATREGQPVAAWLRLVEVEFKPQQAVRVLDSRQEFDVAPELMTIAPVEYPVEARENRRQGIVLVRVLVGENGRVIDWRIIQSAGSSLDNAALAAAKTAVFKPATRQGKPVAVWRVLPIEFSLFE